MSSLSRLGLIPNSPSKSKDNVVVYIYLCRKNMDRKVERDKVAPFRWADETFVAQQGENLLVWGDRKMWNPADLLIAYKQEIDPPHLQFANCDTDAKLIAFVERFGPVHGFSAMSGMWEWPAGDYDKILDEASVAHEAQESAIGASKNPEPTSRRQALIEQKTATRRFFEEVERGSVKYRRPHEWRGIVQNLGELRTERTLLKTAIALAGRLLANPVPGTPAGTEAIDDLVVLLQTLPDGTRGWGAQFEREQSELRSEYDQVVPEWRWNRDDQRRLESMASSASDAASRRSPGYSSSFASVQGDPHTLSRNALVLLLNAFPLSLQWHGDASIEVPPYHLFHGIRPLLFAMLRMDLLQKRHIRMCIREGCPNYFVGRIDKDCCSKECSVKVASKKRYALTVKPARQKASAKKKAAKSRRKEI
jgi:hypothetical protein